MSLFTPILVFKTSKPSVTRTMSQTKPTTIKGFSPSKAAFAKYLVRSLVVKDLAKVPLDNLPKQIVGQRPEGQTLPGKAPGDKPLTDPSTLKIGIIGAGISGLYTALILQSLNIDYDILEANPDRVGGRLYTYYFDQGEQGKNQYYDIGAMRFPKTPIMQRTFDLFDRTKLELGNYVMGCTEQPMRYNDYTRVFAKGENKWANDPFKVSTRNRGPVPDETVKRPDEILNDAYYPYRRKIKRALDALVIHDAIPDQERKPDWADVETQLVSDLERAWQYLMNHDKFSLRDYLAFVEGQDDESINWLETLNAGTGWFDQAFTENVLESLAFEYINDDDDKPAPAPTNGSSEPKVEWKYIKDGTYMLTEKVLAMLRTKPEMGKQVTKMSLINSPREGTPSYPGQQHISVHIHGEQQPRAYDSVLSSTTFGAMQKMDLSGLDLPYGIKAALRSLRYDPSTKVAIQFKSPWWINPPQHEGVCTGIKGGLGKTDLPLRTCVYPSYNFDPVPEGPAVLLCSYTWGADSERIASMVNPVSTADNGQPGGRNTGVVPPPLRSQSAGGEQEAKQHAPAKNNAALTEVIVDNLARLHSTTPSGYTSMHSHIRAQILQIHAYDWSKDPYTCGGAFALYSPSQFRTLYPFVVRPAADSRVHVIGEAASAHHAWIVGALDSAARGVYLMLERYRLFGLQKEMVGEWGEVGEVDAETAHVQVALGMLGREEVGGVVAAA